MAEYFQLPDKVVVHGTEYKPRLVPFLEGVVGGSYKQMPLPETRAHIGLVRHLRQSIAAEVTAQPDAHQFLHNLGILDHGVWAIRGAEHLNALYGNRFQTLYIDTNGKIGGPIFDAGSASRLQDHDRLLAKWRVGLPDFTLRPYYERVSVGSELSDIVLRWNATLPRTAEDILASSYLRDIKYQEAQAIASRKNLAQTGLAMDSLLDYVDTRLHAHFRDWIASGSKDSAAFLTEPHVDRQATLSWLNSNLRISKVVSYLELFVIKYKASLNNAGSEAMVLSSSSDPIANLEAALVLVEHIEGIKGLMEHDKAGKLDYQRLARDIFFSGALASYFISLARLNLPKDLKN